MPKTSNKKRCYDEDIFDCVFDDLSHTIEIKSSLDKAVYHEYDGDIVGFCKHKLGIELTDPQIEVALSVVKNSVTNCKAGHNLGKSNLAACLIFYWTLVKNGLVITTAPTLRQVKNVLWAESKRLFVKNSLPGTMLTLNYNVNDFCYASGFTGAKGNESGIAGVHYENLLAIIDEANGVEPSIDEGIQSMVSGASNRLLRISNPLVAFTPFYYACRDEGCITLRCFDHPNVSYMYEHIEGNRWPTLRPEIDELIVHYKNGKRAVLPIERWPESPLLKKPLIPSAISPAYIEKCRAYGDNSGLFLSRICGEFPVSSENPLFFEYLLESVIHKSHRTIDLSVYGIEMEWDEFIRKYKQFTSCKVLGVDVVESVDPHSISEWYDYLNTRTYNIPVVGDHQDIQRLEDYIVENYPADEGWILYIDGIGVGSKLPGDLQNKGYIVEFVCWGESATQEHDDFNYRNLKTQHIYNGSNALKDEKVLSYGIEDVEDLFEEFLAHTYKMIEEKTIGIIAKKDVKKMIGRSPNSFDSWILGLNGVIEHSIYDSFHERIVNMKGVR